MPFETLRAIDGVGLFPVVSLLLFVTVFTVMLVRTARLDRARLDGYARLPLADATPASTSASPSSRGTRPAAAVRPEE